MQPDTKLFGPDYRDIRQDILPSAFALTMYIQFLLISSFLVIHSRAMGSTSTNHVHGHIGISSVKD
jgi:hypothetical protein